jgi:excisionase family DNA binding protein
MPRNTASAPKKGAAPRTDPDVLTLAEAAAYLRVPEADVVRLIHEQGLPGRPIGREWRFLKAAVQDWLRGPSRKEAILMQIGALKDDPTLEPLVEEIYKRRGRPVAKGA